MPRVSRLRFALAASALVWGWTSSAWASAEVGGGAARWSDRDEAFFNNALIDLRRHTVTINGRMLGAIDCSTADTLCFDAVDFRLQLPAKCSTHVEADVKARGGRVLGSYPVWGEHLDPIARTVYVVIDPKFPQIAYDYEPSAGIVGLSYWRSDWSALAAGVDFAKVVEDGQYQTRRYRDWSWSSRVSLDPFGACRAT